MGYVSLTSSDVVRARKDDCAPLVQWAVFLVQLLTLLVLWASWKEVTEQACYITCPEKMCRGAMA